MHNIHHDTHERRERIRKMLKGGAFADQEEILASLSRKGLHLTQATLSRDLAAIGAVKRGGSYVVGPLGFALDGACQIASMQFVPPNMIVLRTTPGLAQAAAYFIDGSGIEEVAGTIAGDDTIFVAISASQHHSAIQSAIAELFSRPPNFKRRAA